MASTPKGAADYLRQMTRFAEKLGDAKIDHAAWAADKRYIRINGGGLRPVSLCHVNPCGALKNEKSRKSTHRLVDARLAGIADPDKIRNKPEHRLQAALIEHVLRWPAEMPKILHLENDCDELRFVTDELKVEEIRADVLLLGRKGAVWFPVFIELKVLRSKAEIVDQVLKIRRKVTDNSETSAAFMEFVLTAARVDDGDVDLSKSIAMIIWPAAQGTPQNLEAAFNQGIKVLEFPTKPDFAKPYRQPELTFTAMS